MNKNSYKPHDKKRPSTGLQLITAGNRRIRRISKTFIEAMGYTPILRETTQRSEAR